MLFATKIGKSDYVLLKVMGKRKICYYVGQIVKKQGIFCEVKYLVKTGRNNFVLKNDTVCEIDEDDIICKLPSPIIARIQSVRRICLIYCQFQCL